MNFLLHTVEPRYFEAQGTGVFCTNYPKFGLKYIMKIIERNGHIARNEQCLLFPQFFSLYRIDKLPAILRLREIVDSKLFFYLRESKIFPWQWLIICIAYELLHGFESSTFEVTRFYCYHVFQQPFAIGF